MEYERISLESDLLPSSGHLAMVTLGEPLTSWDLRRSGHHTQAEVVSDSVQTHLSSDPHHTVTNYCDLLLLLPFLGRVHLLDEVNLMVVFFELIKIVILEFTLSSPIQPNLT